MPRKPKVEKARGVFEKPKGSGIYWIRYTDANGVRRAESVGRRGDAVERYQQRRLEIRTGVRVPLGRDARGVKLSSLIDDALAYSKNNHRDFRNFAQRLEVVRGEYGFRSAESIKPKEWGDWLEQMANEWEWAAATYNRYKAAISKVYKIALQNSHVSSNPCRSVPQKPESRGRVRYLLPDEEIRLRDVIRQFRPYCVYQLDIALHTGMRRGEQFTVEWSQVDLKMGHIYLDKTKNGSTRYVHLNETAVASLNALKQERKNRNFEFPTLFYDRRGEPIDNPRMWFAVACDEAKIAGVTWHTLRHTFASRLVMKGVDLKTVQDLMGHKTIAMTARYAHLAPAHLKAAVAQLG